MDKINCQKQDVKKFDYEQSNNNNISILRGVAEKHTNFL